MDIGRTLYTSLRVGALVCLAFASVLGQRAAFAQAPLFTEVRTLAGGTQPIDPIEKTLTIQTAGQYDVVLTDLQQPAALAAVRLAVTNGTTVVLTATAPGTFHFDATPGTYVVRVVGALDTGKSSGAVGVQVKATTGGQVALEFVSLLQLQAGVIPPDTRVFETDISIATAGDYEVALTDLQLPAALAQLRVAVTVAGGSLAVTLDNPGVATFTATPGTYHLTAIGQADSALEAGLFSVRVRSVATGAVLLSDVEPVANVTKIGDAALGSGARTLTLSDLAFPIALTRSAVVVEQNGQAIARLAAPGTTTFTSPGGTCEVFAVAVPATPPGVGSYGVDIRPSGGAAEFSTVLTAGDAAGTTPAYSFLIDVPSAGSYQLKLADFQFPTAFASLSVAAVQDGVLAGTASSAGPLNLTLAAGKVFVVVAAQTQPGAAALFGLTLAPAGSAATMFETTQGVGRSFSSRKITIATAGSYDASVVDVGFPVNFIDLAAVVTRGADRFGSIINGGTFSFTAATAGDYIVSFLAAPAPVQAGAKQNAGTYGISVAPTPPPPTVSLTASATTVVKGQTVTLTWSSQNATSCTASRDWAGTKAVSGNETTAALQAPVTYTLECANAGGAKASASVSIDVTAAAENKKGGGGALDELLLALLLAVALGRARNLRAATTDGPCRRYP